MEITKFPSICRFEKLLSFLKKSDNPPILSFTGTVKLHGTNGSVRRVKGKTYYQSRTQFITGEGKNDNIGFASRMKEIDFNPLFDSIGDEEDDITIYGEWIGKGVQRGVAISELEKQFVIFSARKNGNIIPNEGWRIPEARVYNILDCGSYSITIDFGKDSFPELEKLVIEVEEKCPWALQFGIEGTGEGIVWICNEDKDARMWFKTKGEKHAKIGKKVMTPVDDTIIAQILPEWRLAQGMEIFTERGETPTIKNIGEYLKWIAGDIKKEDMYILDDNNIEWGSVAKKVNCIATAYFKEQIEV
jgi:hypothetical protein